MNTREELDTATKQLHEIIQHQAIAQISAELNHYLNDGSCSQLTVHHKQLLRRYVRRFGSDVPVGRALALGLMKFNSRYDFDLVNQKFINWLYTY